MTVWRDQLIPKVAEVLDDHGFDGGDVFGEHCTCGWSDQQESHSEHQAAIAIDKVLAAFDPGF